MKGKHGINYTEKASDFKGSIKKLMAYNSKYMIFVIISLILSAVSSVFSIIGPDKLKEITNIIVEGMASTIDLDKVTKIGIFLVTIYVISMIFNYIQSVIMATLTNKFSMKMRHEISTKINRLPLSYFDNTTIGDIISRVINDVDTICQTMNQSLATMVSALTMFFGSIFMMFYTNYILAIAAILSTALGFVLMGIIMSRSQKYFNNVQNKLGDINGHIEEIFSGQSIVKVYNAGDECLKEFDSINDELFENTIKSQFYSGLMHPLMHFIGNFGYVAICILGAVLVSKNVISFGVIVAFMIYVRLFTNPLMQFAQGLTQMQSTAAASERVFKFLEEKEMNEEVGDNYVTLDRDKVEGNLEFEHVKFGYNEDKIIIKDFSAKIKAGSKVAIVGPTGAGKTTIVNLLMKFYDINSGDIKIDGESIKNITRENVHDLFTMVLQDTWLFNGTIKENIRYNKEDITDEQIIDACTVVGLEHYINTLPHGYDTVIGDDLGLSAGQKQLLTIARSMVVNTPFLIFDEATSAVDTRTEKLVSDAMDKLISGRTSFIIAHRLSTIKNADLILVMKDGNIVEQGNHDELLSKNGFYAELYNSQFQN